MCSFRLVDFKLIKQDMLGWNFHTYLVQRSQPNGRRLSHLRERRKTDRQTAIQRLLSVDYLHYKQRN